VTYTITQITREPPAVDPERLKKRAEAQRWPAGWIAAKMWIG